ncbi:MAG: aspartate carbamoyltransferase catalytic subunit [Acidobacteria bacterium]|nr:aspartate carbamoyltransferase catalytic subunit [Acidobacteriota bacterium]
MPLNRRHLLGIEDLDPVEIELILKTGESFREISARPIKKVPALRGKTIINLFFEPSTRTRSSFEIAAKRLSADTVNFSHSSSSALKGETIIDTVKNLQSMAPDALVVRHPASGIPLVLSKHVKCCVINAGDGMHEHPTQALLDMMTIREHKQKLKGLKVAIIGDIRHSRVARSNIYGLTKMGAKVWLCGPPTLLPREFEQFDVRLTWDIREALEKADVAIMLRIQLERQGENFFPSVKEYFDRFGLDRDKLRLAKPDVLVMHPGPINRGVEISSEVADGEFSVILEQVANGIAVRMALLYLLLLPGASTQVVWD